MLRRTVLDQPIGLCEAIRDTGRHSAIELRPQVETKAHLARRHFAAYQLLNRGEGSNDDIRADEKASSHTRVANVDPANLALQHFEVPVPLVEVGRTPLPGLVAGDDGIDCLLELDEPVLGLKITNEIERARQQGRGGCGQILLADTQAK